MLQVIVVVYNKIIGVVSTFDLYTFHYSTLGIPVLYMETVPPGRRGVPA